MLVHYGNHRHYQLSVLSNPIQIRDTLIVHSCCNLGSCTGLQQRSDISISVAGLTVSLIIVSNLAIITLQLLKTCNLQISDYLLGLIVFAISNSLNDGITM